ncbi:MAG: GIY-YIG nuclease family protein [Vagococcus sp.]|nr:GIY-YIG nuclease family protein [Vagococcus sp.]
MARAKNMNLFLMDGTAQGRIKCTLANWTGVAYRIPRTMLKQSNKISLLNQSGVYLLFGVAENTDEPLVYVGQASMRKNGRGILCRLEEHLLQSKKDWWNVAVVFTTSNNSFGPTEVSYLENRFYHMAKEANRFQAENDNDPNPGNLTEEKESELEEYIDYAKLVIGALGFSVFEALRPHETASTDYDELQTMPILYCSRASVDARGQLTSEGFVVFKGSKIRSDTTPSCPSSVKRYRKKYKHLIGTD